MPVNTVVVDRTTKWGNPFVIGQRGMTRAECLYSYRALFAGFINVSCGVEPGIQELYFAYVKQNIHRLRGKNLACWCPLVDKDGNHVPCHADVLLELANALPASLQENP